VPRALAETVALLLLAATLAFAVVRPRGLPEAVVAVPAALLAVLLGVLPARDALEELRGLGPTLGFVAGSASTAVLSLDATVVLLTPVVFATAARLRLGPKPQSSGWCCGASSPPT
jgi:arsenical pump membrane protein